MITIELPGPPVAWTAIVRAKNGHAYSPKNKQKAAAKLLIKKQYLNEPTELPFSLEFHFFMPIPKSFPKKKREYISVFSHVTKPDTTNLQKFAEDCLTGIVFVDDKQVVETYSKKSYSENPRTVIYIYQL